jgi:hypothetical protein
VEQTGGGVSQTGGAAATTTGAGRLKTTPGKGGNGSPRPRSNLTAAWEAEATPIRIADNSSNFFICKSDDEGPFHFSPRH